MKPKLCSWALMTAVTFVYNNSMKSSDRRPDAFIYMYITTVGGWSRGIAFPTRVPDFNSQNSSLSNHY